MKLGGYDLTEFLCDFSIHNFDHDKWKLDQFDFFFFNKDCKTVESASGHPLLDVYKLRQFSY